MKMMPGLGEKYDIELDIISKPKAEYLTDEYFALDFSGAPANMVEDEIITEGTDVDDYTVKVAICKHLGLPEPAVNKKGIIGRVFY